ncbi:hypothetical protein PSRA_1496 [Pseudoscardovia radai]|uniref:Uncharacterized protein n=1 Tax=Pseudoscardovia radai TaxID=987066 RepID=A0A261EUZ3_9BIFI|nr:hypothetical protein [Pseudoscardovia radai]OZG50466.1 hypothetical protein PSRA_1496 [Pseudoscardovia radai]
MDAMTKAYVIRWSEIERGSETEIDPYDGFPCVVPDADWDEATATLYEVADDGDREEIDSETIRLYSREEESETKWAQCERMLAERNGVSEYEVETPW